LAGVAADGKTVALRKPEVVPGIRSTWPCPQGADAGLDFRDLSVNDPTMLDWPSDLITGHQQVQRAGATPIRVAQIQGLLAA